VTTPYASEAFLLQLLGKAVAASASDVHLKVGQPPGARVGGSLVYFRVDKIRPEDTEAVTRIVLAGRSSQGALAATEEKVMAYAAPGVGRFRASIYRQRGSLALVMRSVPEKVPTLEELGLPPAAVALADGAGGLVLIAGPAHSGRTTTMAAMVGRVNAASPKHVVTLEDPIEHLHEDLLGSVSQREVGTDTASFASGIAAAMRQDPDVIAVGDLRDAEGLHLALDAAEAGHLVLAVVRARDAGGAIARVLAFGPRGSAGDLRERLAGALAGVVAQRLEAKKDGSGLALAAEVLAAPAALREALTAARGPAGAP
jgi:twitching motility protein PilT